MSSSIFQHLSWFANFIRGLSNPRRRADSSTVVHGAVYQPNEQIVGSYPDVNAEWTPTALDDTLSNVSQNLALGAWTSAPTENRAWWFSGLQAVEGGYIDWIPTGDDSDQANTPSKTIIEIDLNIPNQAKFRNLSWPEAVQPRAEGGLVWLPYASNGILLAFGGVPVPADLITSGLFPDETSNNISMGDIAIYDIGAEEWAIQQTLGDFTPGPLAQFCTVVATAQDGSGHFVYVYGGYDGTATGVASDAVWVLSVPALQWTQITAGTTTHRRQSHVCLAPTPTQMLSIGGALEFGGNLGADDYLDVFDLSSGLWTHKYNASSSALYEVPSQVVSQIGGGSRTDGFGTLPSDLASTVSSMFSSPYPLPLPEYKARDCATSTSIPNSGKPDSTPSWQNAVVAVASVVGAAIISALIWCIFFRKRKQSENDTASKRWSILSWRKDLDPPPPKSEGASDGSESTRVASGPIDYFGVKGARSETHEMPSNVTSPGYSIYGHASPQLISPQSPYSGSVEVDAQRRHEIMDHTSTSGPRESMSIRNHPLYPRSIAGEYIMSARSDSISHPSEQMLPYRNTGYVSPYELPQDRSNDNLPQPPDGMALEDLRTTPECRAGTYQVGHVQPPTAIVRTAVVARKPLVTDRRISSPNMTPAQAQRPSHQRNQSSISSNIPNMPSPNIEEDNRMSRHIDALPDVQRRSDDYIQQQPQRQMTRPFRNTFQEQFDANNTWP